MKIFSWNVNGIRAALKKGFLDFFEETGPDILCIQETKARPDQVELELPGEYELHWNSAEKKGYSGTLIISRVPLLSVSNGLGKKKHDREGRLIAAELEDLYLVNVYTPNAQRELGRLDYRTQEWDPDFRRFLKRLEKNKPVVFCGDLNVSHQEIDLARPGPNRGNAGFTDEERATFDALLESGFIDTFREFEQGGGHYSWWSYRGRSREKNIGWRLDYFGISKALRPRLKAAGILPGVMGSDHCPVWIELD